MLHEFRAQITEATEGGIVARLVPFGEKVPYGKGTVEFAAGAISFPQSTPLTVDHSGGVLDRIGVLSRHFETDTGLFGEFSFADTPKAQEVRELLSMGAVTDVSVGVELADDFTGGVMEGTLDHVSVVSNGRFGKAENPSKVLSVHDAKEPTVADIEETTAPVVAYDDSELKTAVAEMADKLDTFETKVVDEPNLFSSMGDFVLASLGKGDNASERMAKFAMSADTTTTGGGVVPDYLSAEYLSIIATSRAFLGNIQNDPIGSAGMSVVYPVHSAGPSVTVQATELTEPASTTLAIGTMSVDLDTYAGANRVSVQLIERSAPSFVDILFRELAGQYSQVTDKAGVDAAVAGAGGTAVVADLSTDAAATFAAFNVANSAIITATREPADTVWLAADRWAELNSLVDADGRPLLVYGANGPMNAQGQSEFNTMVAQYHGWTVRLDVDATNGTCLIANSKSAANLELNPVRLSVQAIDTLSTDFGVWGMQGTAIKYAGGLYTLTTA